MTVCICKKQRYTASHHSSAAMQVVRGQRFSSLNRVRPSARSVLIRPSATSTMSTPQVVLGAGSAEPAAGPDRLHPTFITTWSCPYAQRTWLALNAKQLEYTPVFVDLKNKPEWFFKHNEYGRVPTLVWQEEGKRTASLYESLVCNEYLADLPGPALLPEDPTQRARARLIIDQYGAKAGAAFGKLMFAADPGSAAADLSAALKWAEGQVSSEGPFFMGKHFGLVDAALFPFFLRLRLLEKMGLFTVPEDLPKLKAWESACLAHPAVTGTMQPPDSSRPYLDQLLDNYQQYITERKAAMAKQ